MKTPVANLVSDELWAVARLLPAERPKPKGGRPTVPNRAALAGIVFVLKGGIGWESLPLQLGCGSGMTCWPRLRDWQAAGVWEGLHRALLQRLADADQLDWSRAALGSASVPAKRGANRRVRTRRIAAGLAASGTSSSTATASRSR